MLNAIGDTFQARQGTLSKLSIFPCLESVPYRVRKVSPTSWILIIIITFLFVSGCTDVKTPTAHYALTHPLDTEAMVVAGTSKSEIIAKWDEPSEIIEAGYDDMGLKKEVWLYKPWFPAVPVDYRHLSKGKKIFFTGDYATGYEDIE